MFCIFNYGSPLKIGLGPRGHNSRQNVMYCGRVSIEWKFSQESIYLGEIMKIFIQNVFIAESKTFQVGGSG